MEWLVGMEGWEREWLVGMEGWQREWLECERKVGFWVNFHNRKVVNWTTWEFQCAVGR